MYKIAERSSGVAGELRTVETQRCSQIITKKCGGHFENINWPWERFCLLHQWVRASSLVIKHKGLLNPPHHLLNEPSMVSSQKCSNGKTCWEWKQCCFHELPLSNLLKNNLPTKIRWETLSYHCTGSRHQIYFMITSRTNIMWIFKRKSVSNDDLIKEYRHGISILKGENYGSICKSCSNGLQKS